MPLTRPTRTVGIFLYDDVEVLDFSGPFEVFATASRVKARLNPASAQPFRVLTLAAAPGKVTARGGLVVTPEYDLSNHPNLHVLIVPGGVVTSEMENNRVIDWIKQVSARTEITASVCTGAFLLARAGLLDGLPATTH
jgi:transcriptional regulator GlxA family with amidase domain